MGRKLEGKPGGWQLVVALEVGSLKVEAGSWEPEVKVFGWEVGRLGARAGCARVDVDSNGREWGVGR